MIEKGVAENVVKSSWLKLFTHFSDAMDPTRKKRIIDIDRETTKKRIIDLVSQLSKVERENDVRGMFVMPWSYVVKDFESESDERGRIWEQEKSKDYDARIDNLEKKMDKKHSELLSAMRSMLESTGRSQQQQAPIQGSYAGAVGGLGGQGHQYGEGGRQLQGGAGGQRLPQGVRQGQQQGAGGRQNYLEVPSFSGLQNGNQSGRGFSRSRSPSIKRFRNEDGSATEIEGQFQSGQNKKNKKTAVIGTSNSAVTGRKMKSPPADIFVWGIHPETTIEDIINDLAASDIKVEVKDIEQKSKKEAYLVSYKISVPASDLSKALNPDIWPLRVRVREFIHYARRNPQSQRKQSAERVPQQTEGGGHTSAGGATHRVPQPVQGQGQPSAGGAAHRVPQQAQGQGQPQQQNQLYPNLSNMNLWNVLCGPGVPNPNL